MDGVDLEAARSRGIWVANVPASGGNADSVAEHTILLILATLRQSHHGSGKPAPRRVRCAPGDDARRPYGHSLRPRSDCAGTGTAIARLWCATGWHNPRSLCPESSRTILDAAYSVQDRDTALAQTHILVLCLPLSEETRGVIGDDAFAALPPGAFLVNPARGALVDSDALYTALAHGRLGGIGLDVYWQEPIAPDDPLLAFPNVIATPHIAGITDRSYDEIAKAVVENIERLRRGEPPLHRAD